MGISNFFFVKQNEDGTYSEPIKAEVVDLDFTTQGVGDPTPIPRYMLWNGELTLNFEDDPYKVKKEIAWAILNLKRSTKHLVSKNILGR